MCHHGSLKVNTGEDSPMHLPGSDAGKWAGRRRCLRLGKTRQRRKQSREYSSTLPTPGKRKTILAACRRLVDKGLKYKSHAHKRVVVNMHDVRVSPCMH